MSTLLMITVAIVAGLVGSLTLHYLWRGADSVRHNAHRHLHMALALLIVCNVTLGFTAQRAYQEITGGALPTSHRVTPQAALVRAGAAGPVDGPNLQYLLPPMDPNGQGNTNACGAWTLAELVYGALTQAGSPPPEALSPWKNHWMLTGGVDRPSTMDEQVATMQRVGVELMHDWPSWGGPDAHDAAATIMLPRIGLHYIADSWPQSIGQAGIEAIKGANDHGHLVGVLWAVNDDALHAWGRETTDNSGGGHFLHFSVIDRHQGDNLHLYNSWGTGWGAPSDHGTIRFLEGGPRATIYEAFTISVAGPVARWLIHPAARPTATAIPRRIAPTATPLARAIYTTVHPANLHAAPVLGSRAVLGLSAGAHLAGLGQLTPHWAAVSSGRAGGWILRAYIARSR